MNHKFNFVNICLACAVVVSLATTARAAQQPTVDVKVAQDTVTLHVVQATPLNLVLDELCRQAHADCDGTQLAADITVAGMKFSGDWERVLDALLHGTQLDYVFVSAASGHPPKLLLRSSSSTAGAEHRLSDSAGAPSPANSGAYAPVPLASEAQNVQSANDSVPSEQGSSFERAGFNDSMPFPAAPGQSPPPAGNSGSTGLMFPDATGGVPPQGSNAQGMTSILFPDSTGAVPPQVSNAQGVTGMPFPDSSGRTPPQTGGNANGLLFPDSTGARPPAQSIP